MRYTRLSSPTQNERPCDQAPTDLEGKERYDVNSAVIGDERWTFNYLAYDSVCMIRSIPTSRADCARSEGSNAAPNKRHGDPAKKIGQPSPAFLNFDDVIPSIQSIRAVPSLDNDFTPIEWRNIHNFYARWFPKRYAPRRFVSALGTRVSIPLFNVGIGHSSKLCRIAILVLSTFLQSKISDRHTLEYLSRFYRQAHICIKNQSVLELVYGSYLVAVYALIGGVSPRMAIDNCWQFCRSLMALQSWMLGEDEVLWLETLWQRILSSLYYVQRDNIVFDRFGLPLLPMEFEALPQLLLDSAAFLPSDDEISSFRFSSNPARICQKIYSLSIYMQFYWNSFLFQATIRPNSGGFHDARASLETILGRIIDLISQLPDICDYIQDAYPTQSELETIHDGLTNEFLWFENIRPRGLGSLPKERDTALALLYVFARLLKTIFDPTVEYQDKVHETNLCAIAICRLCASFPTDCSNALIVSSLVKRSIFWAGMIMTRSYIPIGTALRLNPFLNTAHEWIKDRFVRCIRDGYRTTGSIVIEREDKIAFELMEISHRRNSFDDIWAVAVENISLFQYNSTLVTWFFGLNMVRFEQRPERGRSLEIY